MDLTVNNGHYEGHSRAVISIKLLGGGGGVDEQNLSFTILLFVRFSATGIFGLKLQKYWGGGGLSPLHPSGITDMHFFNLALHIFRGRDMGIGAVTNVRCGFRGGGHASPPYFCRLTFKTS